MRQREPCVYILASRFNGTLYTGVTSDLIARLYQHREGITKGFAAERKALRLVYFERHETMEAAIRREKSVKRWLREWKMNLIERDNPHWSDLAIGLGFEPLAFVPETTVDPGTRPGDGVVPSSRCRMCSSNPGTPLTTPAVRFVAWVVAGGGRRR